MVTIKIKKKKYNPDYQHKEGGDNLVDLPPELAYLEEYNFKAYRYGNSVFLQGPGYDMKVIDEILKKINNQESVVIAITGPPGTGKTYLGMALAQILDSKFHCTDTPTPDPKEDDGQIPFTREHLMHLTGEDSPLKRGQVVLPDETHFGIGARGWQKRDQQDLTNYIAAIRSKGYVLIMIVLHTQMIDKMVRDFVINYEIRVTNRGEGIVYRRWFPPFGKEVFKKRIGKIKLPLPDHELCSKRSCLGCSYLSPKKIKTRCMTLRAIYERRKEDFLNTQSKEDEEENAPIEDTESEVMIKIFEYQDLLHLNSHHKLEVGDVMKVLKKINNEDKIKANYGRDAAKTWKSTLEREHPELLKNIALRDSPPKEYPEDVSLA